MQIIAANCGAVQRYDDLVDVKKNERGGYNYSMDFLHQLTHRGLSYMTQQSEPSRYSPHVLGRLEAVLRDLYLTFSSFGSFLLLAQG